MSPRMIRGLFVAVLICAQLALMCGCGHSPDQHSTGSPDAAAEPPPRKVVQVDWHAKLATLQKELARDPNSAFLHNQAAVAYDALGDFESFDREIHIAMKLEPRNPIDCYVAYAVYKRRRLREKQRSVLERALEIDPGNPFGHYERAGMLEDEKKWADALAEYETTKTLLDKVMRNSERQNFTSWSYVDPTGAPYDVTFERAHIDDDIARVRAAASGSK
jgi:tetratricopeptide (TPR) repeat protein